MLRKRTRVNATPDEIWSVLSDPSRYPEFFVGITRWEPADDDLARALEKGEAHAQVGDRWWIRMGVGAIEAGGRIRFTEVVPGRKLQWVTEAGTDHTLSIVITPGEDGTSGVAIHFELRLLGGLLSKVATRSAYRIVGRNLKATLHVLRHLVEYEHDQD